MPRIWIEQIAALLAVAVLAGCATSKDKLLPHGDRTMHDVWDQQTDGSAAPGRVAQSLLDARARLRRPLTDEQTLSAIHTAYTRTAATEIYSQFHRLPNPDLVLYVFSHLAGSDPVPVPGYTTIFPLYQRVQYALPGERLEDY